MSASRKEANRNKANKSSTSKAVIIIPQQQSQSPNKQSYSSAQNAKNAERAKVIRTALEETVEELKKEKDMPTQKRRTPTLNVMRYRVVMSMIVLIGVTAIFAAFTPQGMEVFTRLLPVFTLVLGYLSPTRSELRLNRS